MARPARLTKLRQQRIVESLTAGDTIRVAAETSGLGERTLNRYLARGKAAENALREHLDGLTPLRAQVLDRWPDQQIAAYIERRIPTGEFPYWQLWQEVTRARAAAEERAVSIIREVGLGYEARETVVIEKQVLTKAGDVLTLTTSRTVVRWVRDWKAEAWWLERSRREDWGARSSLEVSGADGGPVVVEDVDAKKRRARELAEGDVAVKRGQRGGLAAVPDPPAEAADG